MEELNNGGSSEMQPHSQFHNAQQQQQQQHSSASAAVASSSNSYTSQYSYYPPTTQQSQNPNPNNSIPLENPSLQFDPSSYIDPYAAVISYNNNTHVGGEGGYAAQATAVAYSHQPTQTGVYSEHAYLQNPSSIVQYGDDPAAYSAAGLTPSNGMEQMMPANLNPDSDSMSTAPMVQPPTESSTKKEPKEINIVQSAWCEICKIACTTKDVLDIHKAGKKHKKNLKKLEEPNNPSVDDATSTNPITRPQENTNPSSSSSVEVQQTNKRPSSSTVPAEDVETKRRKLMEVGATEDSVRVCTICNVVVNSETVFSYHLAGQKHASMVKKQADGTTTAAASTGPEAVTVA